MQIETPKSRSLERINLFDQCFAYLHVDSVKQVNMIMLPILRVEVQNDMQKTRCQLALG